MATMTRGRGLVHSEVLPAEVEEESEAAVAEAGERSDDALGRKLCIADEVDVDHGTALFSTEGCGTSPASKVFTRLAASGWLTA